MLEKYDLYFIDEFIDLLKKGKHLTGSGFFMNCVSVKENIVPEIEWIQSNRKDYNLIAWLDNLEE